MNLDDCVIKDEKQRELCENIFKLVDCDLLWVMHTQKGFLDLSVTDASILEHYWKKQYYLKDPTIPISPALPEAYHRASSWIAHLGSDCEPFNHSGFLYDLRTLFEIQEFVSIQKYLPSKTRMLDQSYCFRFFTRNNRFVFMNKLLNNMPFIKFFMNAMIEQLAMDIRERSEIKIVELK